MLVATFLLKAFSYLSFICLHFVSNLIFEHFNYKNLGVNVTESNILMTFFVVS